MTVSGVFELHQAYYKFMKSTLSRIHSAGYLHGDVARRNFCKVFMVDFQMSQPGNDEALKRIARQLVVLL